jgi:hypothetical protein
MQHDVLDSSRKGVMLTSCHMHDVMLATHVTWQLAVNL